MDTFLIAPEPHPQDPLWMALQSKNRQAAHALLDTRSSLPRAEAGKLALLTLQWAPDLLERILSLAPDKPYYWLQHKDTPEGKHPQQLQMRGLQT